MFMSVMEPIVSSYKAVQDIKQDAAVARRLGLERTALANYKKGIRKMPDRALAELADGLKMSLEDLIAAANIGLENNTEEEREYWFSRVKDERIKQLASMCLTWPMQSVGALKSLLQSVFAWASSSGPSTGRLGPYRSRHGF